MNSFMAITHGIWRVIQMPKRILVDATHIEETRMVVLENGRVHEFDSETSIKQQLKGNIYLAKITRVEPSLQAAFVEYGGTKHGFLPFSEIHPDYYNIPIDDKKELLRSIMEAKKNSAPSEDDADFATNDKKPSRRKKGDKLAQISDQENEETHNHSDDTKEDNFIPIEINNNDDDENLSLANFNIYRKYKIQEVIKKNQIVLVQVEKEERGNKGASLTSFITLAGKYCVLMPNAMRQGGVSRRIASSEDRKRLKKVIDELSIPEETGIIIRTAGAGKSGDNIRSDYDYLAKLWNDIREKTLSSDAPAFIYAEGDIIKKTIRDVFDETTDEILIEGDEAYNTAHDFMKLLMPSNCHKLKKYRNKVPLFSRYRVEEQIASLYLHSVPLESGGSIVVNPTEALISIDVNSGKSTSQRSVEETALSTNTEAAFEIARQLKLRDLSGLIVIDFIDMVDYKNRRSIEKSLKQAFQHDKAKIQIGRISSFGLLEMSRQRLGSSFFEVNTRHCRQCAGTGLVKAPESASITVLRAIENEISRSNKCSEANIFVASEVAFYILNKKRKTLSGIEDRYNVAINIAHGQDLGIDSYIIEKIFSNENVETAQKTPDKNNNSDLKLHQKEDSNPTNENKAEAPNARKKGELPTISTIFEGLWRKIVE